MEQLYCTYNHKGRMIRTLFSRSSFPAEKTAERIISAIVKIGFMFCRGGTPACCGVL